MNESVREFLLQLLQRADLWQLVFAVLASVGAPLWAAFKLWANAKFKKYQKAVEIVEWAVEELYVNVVRDLKKKRPGEKLTKKDILAVREQAIELAKQRGLELGIDIIKVIGVDKLPVLIAQTVTWAKGRP